MYDQLGPVAGQTMGQMWHALAREGGAGQGYQPQIPRQQNRQTLALSYLINGGEGVDGVTRQKVSRGLFPELAS